MISVQFDSSISSSIRGSEFVVHYFQEEEGLVAVPKLMSPLKQASCYGNHDATYMLATILSQGVTVKANEIQVGSREYEIIAFQTVQIECFYYISMTIFCFLFSRLIRISCMVLWTDTDFAYSRWEINITTDLMAFLMISNNHTVRC